MQWAKTVSHIGLAALLVSAAMNAYAQPAPAIPPIPIASDAALLPSPIPADTALPAINMPAAPRPDNVAITPAAAPEDRSNMVIVPAAPLPGAPAPVANTAEIPPAPPAPVGETPVALPSLAGADAPNAPELAPEDANAEIAAEPAAPLKFDDFGASLFYKPQDISKLKAALDIADALARKAAEGVNKVEEAFMPAMPEPPKIQISEYPVFHLSSIMYQGAGKWVIWLNGTRTTSKNLPTDLKVLSIGTQTARFEWKPQIYPALETRWKSEEGDAAKTSMRKLLSGGNLVNVDDKSGAVTFVLRPNQTYSSAYNAVLEGKQVPVAVAGDSGVIDVGAFEQTLRENQARNAPTPPPSAAPTTRVPRIVRPGVGRQPGAPILGSSTAPAQQTPPRRSGLVNPDTSTLGQVPAIFPGGVPAAANTPPQPPQSPSPPPPPESGLPILPPGAQ